MKILNVHDFYALGNGRYGHDIACSLAHRGNEVYTLAGANTNIIRYGKIVDGVVYHTYPYEIYRKRAYNCKKLFEQVQKDEQFDVAIFYQPLSFHMIYRSELFSTIPTIVYNFLSPWQIEWQINNKLLASIPIYKDLNILTRNRVERKALNIAKKIITISRYMYENIRQLHPMIPSDKRAIIHCGVDTHKFSPNGTREFNRRLLNLPKDKRLIFTVRRLVPRMGVDSLIKAMPDIVKAIPDVFLIIGGDGPQRRGLESLSKSLDCKDRIRFTGFIDDNDLPTYYRSADLVVLPTKALEGFGLITIEAMACETPVIGTPVGAIPEVLGSFDKALLLEGTEPKNIAKGVIAFFNSDKHKNQDYRKACRDYVIKNYYLERQVEKLETFIKDLAVSQG